MSGAFVRQLHQDWNSCGEFSDCDTLVRTMRQCNVAGTDDHAGRQCLQLGRVGTVWSNARRRSYQLAAKPHEWMIFRQLRRIAFAPLVQREPVTMRRLANQFYDGAGIYLGAVAEFNAGGGF